MIAVFQRLHGSLLGDIWSIAIGARVRFGADIYWRGIAIAIEVISALATLGILGALPPLLNVVANSIRDASARFVMPLIKASPH